MITGARDDLPHSGLRVELPRRAETVRTVREIVRHLLVEARAESSDLQEIELAASELATNAVLHADGANTYEVAISLDGVSCEIAVSDRGRGFDPQEVAPPTLDLSGGRGLAVVQAVMDEVTVQSAPGTSTTVHARKRLAKPKLESDGADSVHGDLRDLVGLTAGTVRRFSTVVSALGGVLG